MQLGRIRRHQQQLETQRRRLEQLTGFLDHVLVCPYTALTDCTTCTAILEISPEAEKARLR